MYDSLSLWHRGACLELAPLLSQVAEHQRGQSYYITGNLQNFNVVLSEQGASFKGSLCKWFCKDSLQTSTRSDSQRAIEALSDITKLPLQMAKVSRVDVAHNFLMRNPPTVYFPYLGDCLHYKRNTKATSLYYENGNRTKLFYDKIAESKASGVIIPDLLQNQNLLRFELRFMQRLDKAFNKEEITAQMLYDETFYIGIIDKWINEYQSITKLTKMAFKENVQLEPKDFVNQILLKSIIDLGGQNQVFELIEEARKRGQFKRPEYASRTKGMIKELCQLQTLTEPSELVQELDQKIKQVKAYYR